MTAVRGNPIKQLFCAFFVQPDERRRSANGISYVIPMAANVLAVQNGIEPGFHSPRQWSRVGCRQPPAHCRESRCNLPDPSDRMSVVNAPPL